MQARCHYELVKISNQWRTYVADLDPTSERTRPGKGNLGIKALDATSTPERKQGDLDIFDREAAAKRALDINARRFAQLLSPDLECVPELLINTGKKAYSVHDRFYRAYPEVTLRILVPYIYDPEDPQDRRIFDVARAATIKLGPSDYVIDDAGCVRLLGSRERIKIGEVQNGRLHGGQEYQSLEFQVMSARRLHGMLMPLVVETLSPTQTDTYVIERCEMLAAALSEAADRLEAGQAEDQD